MKISKLFHWLYAFLMFLPIFIFIPTAFYYGFNEHATNETTTQVDIQYKYESNEVNSVDDLIEGNIYFADNLQFAYDDYSDVDIYLLLLSYDSISVDGTSYIEEVIFNNDSYNSLEDNYIFFNYFGESSFHLTNGNTYVSYNYEDSTIAITNVNFLILDGLEDFKFYISTFVDSNITSSDFNVIESVDVQTDVSQSITQKMSDALVATCDTTVISWSKDTFMTEPFYYITDLFNVPHDSPINTLLSYWLSVSIIYLVFDLLMYVPLLCHNWIDKARIE